MHEDQFTLDDFDRISPDCAPYLLYGVLTKFSDANAKELRATMQSCPNFIQASKALADLNFELSDSKMDSLASIYNASDLFKNLVQEWDSCDLLSQKTE